ncbi:hypothetical protein CA600_22695 [Paenibacillus sp. VTT E-133280]|uniref:helix-turn-helix domain-containing protein n=1 Tax=unclassified Paenibacillus TaxID=185978 RepID=UPI000BA0D697|nr:MULTISPECIES: helix-turn-helix transcriptional regulator [unclassified Paenibacillus]MBY3621310.1 helix-turn-helix transcriptional regulator [Acinetobacter sp. CUI P1]MDH6373095.1 transcriptional regulator with XRE-family HTH domain [Paenibacillus sp. PastF-3]OZQ62245.1 hypothetical protein CA600_22695 [Paenibacillus sp. VTT E-133280]OZQ97544.1 hypothetical protein CA598_05860 [Paenibacillus sp. VTT E-133291]
MNEDYWYKIIGGNIRSSRVTRGITQKDLGLKLNISRPSIANIEAGRQRIQVHFLFQLAEALDTSIQDLINIS